jgi:hypothetical protein
MFIGNNVSAPGYLEDRVTGNCSGEPNCLDDIFTAVQNCYGDLQDYFSVQISNVNVSVVYSQLKFDCLTSSNTYYATVTADQLNNVRQKSFHLFLNIFRLLGMVFHQPARRMRIGLSMW